MNTATNSAGDSLQARDDLRASVAELFSIFQRLFGQRWAATFADAKSRPTWLAAFRHAGITSDAVRCGLAKASRLDWPPSCGEFIGLCCEGDAPSLRTAIAEAVRWANGEVFEWGHPAVGAAARDIGSWAIRHASTRELDQAFGLAYRQMLDRFRRGDPLDVPTMRALPAHIRNTTPRGARPSSVVSAEIERAALAAGVSLGEPRFPSSTHLDATGGPPRDGDGAGETGGLPRNC